MGFMDRAKEWDLDIDHYLNRVIPPSPLYRFPTPVTRWLGYRRHKKQDIGNVLGAFWSCVGGFCGLAVIAAVFNNTGSIQAHGPPAMIASFGASAVLEYNAIRSPLGQPRNALLGHTLSGLVGVGITKLFRLRSDFERIRWIAGAVSCGIASAVMLLTGTVHPPGGASAVLAATAPEITEMGWYFVPLVMWGTILMLFVGLIINNIQRQFPMYWWSPLDLREAKLKDEETVPDGRGGLEPKHTNEDGASSGSGTEGSDMGEKSRGSGISISAVAITLPEHLSLNPEEVKVLEGLRERLRKENEDEETPSSSTDFQHVPSHSSTSGFYK